MQICDEDSPAGKAPSFDDNRDSHRAPVTLNGQWCVYNSQDYACATVDMSMCGVRVVSSAKPSLGEDVTVFINELGTVSGKVVRLLGDGFAIDLADAPPQETVNLALFARSAGLDRRVEQRAYPRIVPRHQMATVKAFGGGETSARIIDVSRTGIAIEISALRRHDRVEIGGRPGTVVRAWDKGAAVEFDATIPEDDFTSDISFQ